MAGAIGAGHGGDPGLDIANAASSSRLVGGKIASSPAVWGGHSGDFAHKPSLILGRGTETLTLEFLELILEFLEGVIRVGTPANRRHPSKGSEARFRLAKPWGLAAEIDGPGGEVGEFRPKDI